MAHKGTGAFIAQRASAVLLLPLVIWFLYAAVTLSGAGYEEARAFFSSPLAAAAAALLLALGAYHMRIGLGEVIADYIQGGLKNVTSALNWIVAAGVAFAGVWAAFTLAYSG